MKSFWCLLLLLLAASCAKKTSLHFDDPKADVMAVEKQKAEIESSKKEFQLKKKLALKELIWSANKEFETVAPIIQRKCFDCHDANTPLRFYGRIFRSHNPINTHRENGLKNLDFSKGFPFQSKGLGPEVSILKAIRSSVLTRTMPIKFYTTFYPGRKVNDADEEAILGWVDPLIEKIEAYISTYEPQGSGPAAETRNLFETKCFRCHANGNARGGFGGMEDMKALQNSNYANVANPEASKLYKILESGKMPPDPKEKFTAEELQTLRDWMSKKP